MASSSTQQVLDIDELSASTKKKLLMLPPLSSERCIYSAPYYMRVSNERHFTPKIVSIGPLHYYDEQLRVNQHFKERYLAEFLQITKVSLEECYKLIVENERRLRDCYADVIELNSENFVKMVLVDATFLLMILVYNHNRNLLSNTDQVFGKPKMIFYIRYDILLLENQLPFFILEDLYKFSKLYYIAASSTQFNEETAMISLGHKFFVDWVIIRSTRPTPSSNVHILDMLRSCLIPSDWSPKRNPNKIKKIPSTKELHQAGVKLQVGSEENMFDIRFQDGILEIPPLDIDDSTELVFRNLLAFETCDCTENPCFSYYFEMMKYLTLSSVDTELLIQNGIINNDLSNADEVTKLFHNISTDSIVLWRISLYVEIIKELNEYYKSDWHRWKETLKSKYFKAPWAICSVTAAVILLVLAIVQTVFTILQVVLPK